MSNILETLQKMSESPHDYDIGYWWNAVDNAIEEIERLHQSAETKEALLQEKRTEIERLRSCLTELRLRYHATGRRPEECYEMSLIDEALRK